MPIQIQPVTTPDAETFLDLCAELNAFDGSSPFDRAAMGAALGPLLDDPHKGRAVFLLADGQIAGYLVVCFGWSFEFGGRTGVLEHLFVREAFRGRGLATTDGKKPRRWVVEAQHSWLNRSRSLLIRWSKKAAHHLAFLHIAAAHLTLNRLLR